MARRIAFIFLALVLVFSVVPTRAFAAELVDGGSCGENLTWMLYDDGELVIEGEGAMEDYNGSRPWSSYKSIIKTAKIGDCVTIIGQHAFALLPNLVHVTIGSGVIEIDHFSFSGCTSLESIDIPNGVTSVNACAFSGCTNMVSVSFGSGVTDIGERVFSGCTSLTEISVHKDNMQYSSVDGGLFNEDMTELIACPGGKTGNYEVPGDVTKIGKYAFEDCGSLTTITIPNGVKTIGWDAFYDCTGLTSIEFPASVQEIAIGNNAFASSANLKEIRVSADNENYCVKDGVLFNKDQTMLVAYPGGKGSVYSISDGVTCVGENAFDGCKNLTNIMIPYGVIVIGPGAFAGCSLTNVTIPATVTRIEHYAFAGCSLTSVKIPNATTYIGDMAFALCYDLEEIVFEGNAPTIGVDAFFCSASLEAYYPACSQTWTEDKLQDYGGSVTWTALNHIYPETDLILSDDLYSGTVKATCSCGHIETAGCTVSQKEGENGNLFFTALAELDDRTYSVCKEVNTVNFGEVEIDETEVAYGVVYNDAGKLIYIGQVETIAGGVRLILSDDFYANMHQARLFVLDGATFAPNGPAIEPLS